MTVAFCALLHQYYIWISWFLAQRKLPMYRAVDGHWPMPVSIVICARNGSKHLQKNLPLILTQEYPVYEVVVVDHGSTDSTDVILMQLEKEFKHLKHVYCPFEHAGKKAPLDTGMLAASHDHIVVTDADCTPSSPKWIAGISAPFSAGYSIVLGAGPLLHAGGFVGAFARFDAALVYCTYARAAIRGWSYMGVGRNLAYKKSIYLNQDREQYFSYMGGDDDILVSQARNLPKAVVYDSETLMCSPAPKTYTQMYRQKRRHLSVSGSYKILVRLRLLLIATTHWLSLVLPLVLLLSGGSALILIFLLCARWLALVAMLKKTAYCFVKGLSLAELMAADLWYVVHYPIVALLLLSKPPVTW